MEGLTAEPYIEWSDVLLERLKVAATGSITKQALADTAAAATMVDHLRDLLMFKLESYVTVDPRGRRKEHYTLVSDPVYPSWRHQLLAELPEGGLRQRVLGRLFGIDPTQPLGKRHRLVLDIAQEVIFPEHALSADLGPAHQKVRVVMSPQDTEPAYAKPRRLAQHRVEA
jgi:hypothetical protein